MSRFNCLIFLLFFTISGSWASLSGRSIIQDETEITIEFTKDAFTQFEPVIIKHTIKNQSNSSRYYDESGFDYVVRNIDGSEISNEISFSISMSPDDSAWLYKSGESRTGYANLNGHFSCPLDPGEYVLRVFYRASDNVKNAWRGEIKLENMVFKVIPAEQKVHDLAPRIRKAFFSSDARSQDESEAVYLLSILKGTAAYDSLEYVYLYYISSRTKNSSQRLDLLRTAVSRKDLPLLFQTYYKRKMIELLMNDKLYNEALKVLKTMKPGYYTNEMIKEIQAKKQKQDLE